MASLSKSGRSSLLYSNVKALRGATSCGQSVVRLISLDWWWCREITPRLLEQNWRRAANARPLTQVRVFLFEAAPIWALRKGPLWHDLVAAAEKIWLLRQLRDLLNPEQTMLHPRMWSCFLSPWPGNASLLTEVDGQDREFRDLFWWIWRDAWNTELVESWQTNRVWSNK